MKCVPSFAITSKKNAPVAAGVPLSAPLGSSDNPGGRPLNGASVQETAPVAPVAVSIVLYGEPTFANGSANGVVIDSGVTVSVSWRRPNLAPSDASTT